MSAECGGVTTRARVCSSHKPAAHTAPGPRETVVGLLLGWTSPQQLMGQSEGIPTSVMCVLVLSHSQIATVDASMIFRDWI